MTIAICSSCGEFKHGAFKPCPVCGAIPVEKDELAISMALTDHYLSNDSLAEFREAIQRGQKIILPDEVKEQFQQLIEDSEVLQLIRRASAAESHEKIGAVRRRTPVQVELFDFAEEAFELGHAFVTMRDRVNRECGSAWSVIRNLFRTVDYQAFVNAAQALMGRVGVLRERVQTFVEPSNDTEYEFNRRLTSHIDDLLRLSELTLRKYHFMARKAGGVRDGTPWGEWQKIVGEESTMLIKCDFSGEALTRYYRQLR